MVFTNINILTIAMKKWLFLFTSSLFLTELCYSQLTNNYLKNIRLSEELYKKKLYSSAASSYSKTFELNSDRGMVLDRYNAACCYAMSLNADSAFLQLYRIVELGHFLDYRKCLGDENFKTLQNNPKWTSLINLMKTKEEDELKNILRNSNDQ